MISRVQGTFLTRDSSRVDVETRGGVVYEVEVPLTVFQRLPSAGELVELRTVQIVTESAVSLYGFLSVHERSLFQRLLTASGVGPKLALSMMSTYSAERLARALIDKEMSVRETANATGEPEELVAKMEQLVLKAEYKRRQAPPGVKIGVRNFGRDRRYPISNFFHTGPGVKTPR